MQVEDCLMEIVCHTRWLASFLTTQVDPVVLQRYPGDVEAARQTLFTLSKTLSHIESISEIPLSVVGTLCDGVLYLLIAEVILGHAPPTMHQFLQQTTLQREQSATQAQLLVVRWLLTAGLIQIDDMIEIVFGSDKCLEDFKSDYDAHIAIAKHLAERDPFYLGAHVTIARGLLLHYCITILDARDIVDHVAMIAPDATAELRTLEDALLFWLRSAIQMFASTSPALKNILQSELQHVEDLYLHTNDGRVLALVIHNYNPDLLNLDSVHLTNPLTVWQRQDNWCNIIRAAESLGVWVGVFPDEMVAHGFSTLHLHVLRFVEELFAVLATSVEQSYETLRQSLENGGDLVEEGDDGEGELDADSQFVDKNHSPREGGASEPRQAGFQPLPASAGAGTDDVFDAPSAIRNRLGTASTSDDSAGRNRLSSAGQQQGPQRFELADDVDEQDQLRDGDFNIVLTGLFLQGVSIPIRKEVAPEDHGMNHGSASLTPPPSVLEEIDPCSAPARSSTTSNGVAQQPRQRGDIVPASSAIVGEEPTRTDSPVVVRKSFEDRRSMREANAVASSVAHLQQARKQRKHPAGMRFSTVVQGSMDVEGIESLLSELTTVADNPIVATQKHFTSTPDHSTPGGPESLREQNQLLKWAMEQQRQKIYELVDKLRVGVKKQEFSAIVKHLKSHRPQMQNIGNSPAPQAQYSASPQRSVKHQVRGSQGHDAGRISFASRSTQMSVAGPLPTAQQPLAALRKSLEGGVRSSMSLLKIPGKLVVANVGTSVQCDLSQPESHAAPASEEPPASFAGTVDLDTNPTMPGVQKKAKGGLMIELSTGDLRKAIAKSKPLLAVDRPVQEAPVQPTVQLANLLKLREKAQEKQQQCEAESSINNNAGQQQRRPSDALATAGQHDSDVYSQASTVAPRTADSSSTPFSVKLRNNKAAILNSFRHVLLVGPLNKVAFDNVAKILADYPDDGALQFMVLFKDEFSNQFKGLYIVKSDATINRIFGAGPLTAYVGPQPLDDKDAQWMKGMPYLFPKFFKFDSGTKKFQLLPSKSVNQMTDGVALAAAKPKMVDRERW